MSMFSDLRDLFLGSPESHCSVGELKEKIDRGDDFVLLDVRTHEELKRASVKPCTHIPLQELEKKAAKLDKYRDKEIICMCQHGSRSAMAQRILLHKGFKNVRNLTGGIHAYALKADSAVSVNG